MKWATERSLLEMASRIYNWGWLKKGTWSLINCERESEMVTGKVLQALLETEVMLYNSPSWNSVHAQTLGRSCKRTGSDSVGPEILCWWEGPGWHQKGQSSHCFLHSKALEHEKNRKGLCQLLVDNSFNLSTFTEHNCVSDTENSVRNAVLKIMTEKAELLNPSTLSIFNSHEKFHAGKIKTREQRSMYSPRDERRQQSISKRIQVSWYHWGLIIFPKRVKNGIYTKNGQMQSRCLKVRG